MSEAVTENVCLAVREQALTSAIRSVYGRTSIWQQASKMRGLNTRSAGAGDSAEWPEMET